MTAALWRIATPVEAGAIHPIPRCRHWLFQNAARCVKVRVGELERRDFERPNGGNGPEAYIRGLIANGNKVRKAYIRNNSAQGPLRGTK